MTTLRQLYEETIVLHGDTNEESYPFDHFVRDAKDWFSYYTSLLIRNAKCNDSLVQRYDFDVLPVQTLTPGMDGYMGEYVLPEGFHHALWFEFDSGDSCPKRLPKEKPADACFCSCNSSQLWDVECNTCKACGNECCPTYAIERGLLVLKWQPSSRGRGYLSYVGAPAISIHADGSEALAINDFMAVLIRLRCIRRYMQSRHGGKYDSYEDKHTMEEIRHFEKALLADVNARCSRGDDEGAKVIPISKT